MKRINIALSLGDPAGVGPEVIVKALKETSRLKDAAFFICGDSGLLHDYGLKPSSHIFVVDPNRERSHLIRPGQPDKNSAILSLNYLQTAVSLLKKGQAQCLMTGPISKENIRRAGFSWPGHTEFLADSFHVRQAEMVFVSDRLKVVLVTRHLSLKNAIDMITAERVVQCGRLMDELLKNKFFIRRPKIAVCGLNPHAGEGGLFGDEEKTRIAPAIKKLNKLCGLHFYGPMPSDTVFQRAYQGQFDLVIAMYHDQGLIPFKMVEFENGVNLTAGLPFIRTSPVHGTAFDIAGKNIARHESTREAILLAYRLTKNALK